MALQPRTSFSAAKPEELNKSVRTSEIIEAVASKTLHCLTMDLSLIADILHEPLQRQGMTEPLGLGELVSFATHGGELQALRPLIVEERDLLIAGSSRPTPRHDVGDGADCRIVDLGRRRRRNFPLFLLRSRDVDKHSIASRGDALSASLCRKRGNSETRNHIGLIQNVGPGLVVTH